MNKFGVFGVWAEIHVVYSQKRPYTGLVSTAIMISRPRDWAFSLQYSILEAFGDSYTPFDRALSNIFQRVHKALS